MHSITPSVMYPSLVSPVIGESRLVVRVTRGATNLLGRLRTIILLL